jgi:hypothetical protein
MKLSAPKQVTFWVAVVIGLVGLVAGLVPIPVVSPFAFWVVVVGFVILALANLLEGL